jgi:hypothetical protein
MFWSADGSDWSDLSMVTWRTEASTRSWGSMVTADRRYRWLT